MTKKMNPAQPLSHTLRMLRAVLFATLAVGGVAQAQESAEGAALRSKYTSIEAQLRENQFKRPIYLESAEEKNRVKGEVFAVLNYPYAAVNESLENARDWCDVLILHLNTKYCNARGTGPETSLVMYIGKKTNEALGSAYRTQFRYHTAARTADYFQVNLTAAEGPMGTNNYRIVVEATALPDNKTFLHLSYAYGFGFTGKLAMQAYFSTVGANKVGFSRTGDGYVGGMRGLVERNTMRYYLAIDAYLSALDLSPNARLERRLTNWFTSSEQYPRQLHELDRSAYLDMKRREYERQQMPE